MSVALFDKDELGTIDSSLSIKTDGGEQKYPALQLDCYRPANAKSVINLCLHNGSEKLITANAFSAIFHDSVEASFEESDALLAVIKPEVRWILLGRPGIFTEQKDGRSSKYDYLQKGEKLAGTGKKTVARLVMCAIVNDEILLDAEGNPQIFTFKLRSNNTALISSREASARTLLSLNEKLNDAWGQKGWLTHLVSIAFKITPQKWTSKDGKSSWGVLIELSGNARRVPKKFHRTLTDFAQSDEVAQYIKDPFGIKERSSSSGAKAKAESEAEPESESGLDDSAPVNYDDVPW